MSETVTLDALIFGGGAAGLWTLDVLSARGLRVLLLETDSLGAGQTIASQGIIHGGLKYSLQGLLTRSAAQIREMPRVWKQCLAGERVPNLSAVRLRSEFCYLWRTEKLTGRLGMLGASFGLHVTPDLLPAERRPPVLGRCPGLLATIAEPVVSPPSFLSVLRERNLRRLLQVEPDDLEMSVTNSGTLAEVRLGHGGQELALRPRLAVLAAGSGNGALLQRLGREAPPMQRRPLHMALVRGDLPELCGHCVDGAKTRLTLTSERIDEGTVVWQLGGQLAEDGVGMRPEQLIARAQRELSDVMPGINLGGTEWASFHVDRAEGLTSGGKRPDGVSLSQEGNIVTCWPTKLALVPELARAIVRIVTPTDESTLFPGQTVQQWPRPEVARAPWETAVWRPTARAAAA